MCNISLTLPFPQIHIAGSCSKDESPFNDPDLVKGLTKLVAVLGSTY